MDGQIVLEGVDGRRFSGVCSLNGEVYVRYYKKDDDTATLEVWDLRRKKLRCKQDNLPNVYHVIVSSNGDYVVYFMIDTVYKYNTRTGKIVYTRPIIKRPDIKQYICKLSMSENANDILLSVVTIVGETGEKSYSCYICHRANPLVTHNSPCDYYINGNGKRIVGVSKTGELSYNVKIYDNTGVEIAAHMITHINESAPPNIAMTYDGSIIYACFTGYKLRTMYIMGGEMQCDKATICKRPLERGKLDCSKYGTTVISTGLDIRDRLVSRMYSLTDKTARDCEIPVAYRYHVNAYSGVVKYV